MFDYSSRLSSEALDALEYTSEKLGVSHLTVLGYVLDEFVREDLPEENPSGQVYFDCGEAELPFFGCFSCSMLGPNVFFASRETASAVIESLNVSTYQFSLAAIGFLQHSSGKPVSTFAPRTRAFIRLCEKMRLSYGTSERFLP